MSFEALTQAAWILPAAASGGALVSLALVARRLTSGGAFGFLEAWGLGFAATTIADAVLTSKLSPIGASTALAVFFVILGDFRLFLLAERAARPKGPVFSAARRAIQLALITPILQRVAAFLLPGTFAGKDLRFTFLTYEIICLVVLAVYLKRSTREGDDEDVTLGDRLIGFFLVQYALWAAADALILYAPSLRDIGFGLRLVPNVLYYGVFVPLGYALSSPRLGQTRTQGNEAAA